MIKEWIDKQKVIRELEKMFTFYYKQWQKIVVSCRNNHTDLEEKLKAIDAIQDILYTISYILCHEFGREGKYQDCPWGYKFLIDEYYDKEFGKCIGNYRIIQEQSKACQFDLAKPLKGEITDKQYGILHDGKFDYGYITTLLKGNVYFDVESNKQYMFDGKNLIEMY